MSKLSFRVRTLKNVTSSTGPPLTKENMAPLQVGIQPEGHVHIVLELDNTYKLKTIVFKNAAAASVHSTCCSRNEGVGLAQLLPEWAQHSRCCF